MVILLPYIQEFALAFLATIGFGLLFNVPRRTLVACGLTGAIGRTIRLLVINLGASVAGGSFVGALAVAMAGYWLARTYQTPRTIFTVTGVIPMVPGIPAFSTMLEFAVGHTDKGIVNAVETTLIIGALAMGLTSVRVLSQVPHRTYDGI